MSENRPGLAAIKKVLFRVSFKQVSIMLRYNLILFLIINFVTSKQIPNKKLDQKVDLIHHYDIELSFINFAYI